MHCKGCNEDVPRIESRYRGHRVFVDDKGKHWGYKYCPSCFANRRRTSKSAVTTTCVFCETNTESMDDICKECYVAIEKVEAKMPKLKKRHCRLCNSQLAIDRYFYCRECLAWRHMNEEGFENTTSYGLFKPKQAEPWRESFIDEVYRKYD